MSVVFPGPSLGGQDSSSPVGHVSIHGSFCSVHFTSHTESGAADLRIDAEGLSKEKIQEPRGHLFSLALGQA